MSRPNGAVTLTLETGPSNPIRGDYNLDEPSLKMTPSSLKTPPNCPDGGGTGGVAD